MFEIKFSLFFCDINRKELKLFFCFDSDILKSKKESSSDLILAVKKEKQDLMKLLLSLIQSRQAGERHSESLTEEFYEAGVAVRLVLLLLEAAFAQRLQAEVTHQVVGVEFGPHGGDAAAEDGLLARLTHAATGLVIVGLTQRLSLVFEEAAVDKRAVALPAHEALRVPEGVES